MNIVLTIEANSFEEIAHLFNTPHTAPPASEHVELPAFEQNEGPEVEEVVEPAPKKTRAKRSPSTTDSAPPSEPVITSASAPSDEPVSFEDIRAKASTLLDSGVVDGRAVQEMLTAKFDVRAFTALKPEQFADCLAELNNLG